MAASVYAAQRAGAKRLQVVGTLLTASSAGLVASSTAPSTAPRGPPPGRGLAEKNTPAQPRLKTPSGAKAPRAGVSAGSVPGAAAAFGNKAWPRSFHVIIGASASTRGS